MLFYLVHEISIGVTCAITLLLLVVLSLVSIAVLVKFNLHSTFRDSEREERVEPIYEEILALNKSKVESTIVAPIKMEENCSYGDIKTIKMTESPAYGQITHCNQRTD